MTYVYKLRELIETRTDLWSYLSDILEALECGVMCLLYADFTLISILLSLYSNLLSLFSCSLISVLLSLTKGIFSSFLWSKKIVKRHIARSRFTRSRFARDLETHA